MAVAGTAVPSGFPMSSASRNETKATKSASGVMMSATVSTMELASGPKMSRPPHRNLCQFQPSIYVRIGRLIRH